MFDTLINQPLGHIIRVIYDLTANYGFAIIIFTIVVKILLLPLSMKQQKSMVETQKIQPLLKELQAKYKNDKEKLNTETMKLYKEHKINPLGGCLPLLIQLPILFGLIRVIYNPPLYILHMSKEAIKERILELGISGSMPEIQLAKRLTDLGETGINFNFLGIDLSAVPNYMQPSVLWILPLLAAGATYLSSKFGQAMNANNRAADDPTQSSMQMMNNIFPLMTLFFTFTMPGGASLYWFMSSATQVLQQFLLTKFYAKRGTPLEVPRKLYRKDVKKKK